MSPTKFLYLICAIAMAAMSLQACADRNADQARPYTKPPVTVTTTSPSESLRNIEGRPYTLTVKQVAQIQELCLNTYSIDQLEQVQGSLTNGLNVDNYSLCDSLGLTP